MFNNCNMACPCFTEYHSCTDVRNAGNTNDGHYLIKVSDRCLDTVRIYCHNINSGEPLEYITLGSGTDRNYATVFGKRLVDRYQCDGPTRSQLYAEMGTTRFSKVRFDLRTLTIVGDDFTFSQSAAGGKDISYGTAGDCFSLNPHNCRKGSFMVDLTGTRLKIREDVSWMQQGFPDHLKMQDYNRTSDGTIVSAMCGGWCGRCRPVSGAIRLEPLCVLPEGKPGNQCRWFCRDIRYLK